MERTPTGRERLARMALAADSPDEVEVFTQQPDGMHAVGSLATEVAHELDSSLSYLVGNIDLALRCLARFSVAVHAPLEIEAAQHALREARLGSARLRRTSARLRAYAAKQASASTLIEVQHVTGLSLPAAPSTTSAVELRPAHAMQRDPTLPRLRILVIDDEPHLHTLVRRLLGEHEVTGFRDARQALRLLTGDSDFDVIFCDVMMPAMSGSEFHTALSLVLPKLIERIVFLTGGVFGNSARQFLRAVTNQVIDKPFQADSLRTAIARVMGESKGCLPGQ